MIAGLLSIGSLGGGVVMSSVTSIFRPQNCHPPSVVALRGARQVGMALFDFDSDYGSFPDAATAIVVKEKTGSTEPLGSASSNDLFRQLFAAGLENREEIFYSNIPGFRRPDNVTGGGKTLARGECVFSYIEGGSTSSPSGRPLVVAPLIPGTRLFDREAFEGKAVVLSNDNSAVLRPIDDKGRVIMPNGMDLFDPSQACWGGSAPVVKWPELLPVAAVPIVSKISNLPARHPDVLTWSIIIAVLAMLGMVAVRDLRKIAAAIPVRFRTGCDTRAFVAASKLQRAKRLEE